MTEFSRPFACKPTGAPRTPSLPYRHGKGWAIRRSYKGHALFLSGFSTAAAASKAMRQQQQDIDGQQKPAGFGPERSCLAQAMQDYALERLPFKKGAVQEVRRINAYPVGRTVVNGPHLQIHCLERAKRPLHMGQVLVVAHALGPIHPIRLHRGADDVHAIERRLGRNGLALAREGQ